ncbi:MAG TPA: acyl-CoA reductase [Chthoniobacter sp.]
MPIVFHDFRATSGLNSPESMANFPPGQMQTADVATRLADAAAYFPALGAITAHDLLALVHAELGHAEALDDFKPYGGHLAKAIGPRNILLVVSSRRPAAGLRSLIHGLLLGSHVRCAIPDSNGAAEFTEFRRLLPAKLAARVEIDRELAGTWLAEADAAIVYGGNDTIERVRTHIQPGQIFVSYPQKLSFGVVFEDPTLLSASGAARDASGADQLGGLFPHIFFVAEDPLAYAAKLAAEMERWHAREPREIRSVADGNAIRNQRAALAARADNDEPVVVFQSADAAGWTVAFDPAPNFPYPPIHRFVYVKPLPQDLAATLAEVKPHLACVGIWPATVENARRLTEIGAPRICPLGRMQFPPSTWHRNGGPVLTPLVRWIDAEV